jgi:glycosyltransferase involved in cell wall biosynthesis
MKISIAATNPCHVWEMARELAGRGVLQMYFSGYPLRRLAGSEGIPVKSFPARTVAVYGVRRLLPEYLRPKDRHLFRWQDWAFDQKVARALGPGDFLHGLPGQCRDSFQRARELGVRTVLSHATGPVTELEAIVAPEYERVGLRFEEETQYDSAYYEREAQEYARADFHWASSTIVAERLRTAGVEASKIWTVPYGVEQGIFFADEAADRPLFADQCKRKIVFAGQLSLRKGIRHLLDALTLLDDASIELHFYGHRMAEVETDLSAYRGASKLVFHGAVSRSNLAEVFRGSADLLALPSLEEGYGLVINQALACGLPCLVSDQVGAKDAIIENLNGRIIPVGDVEAWAEAIEQAGKQAWSRREIAASAPVWSNAADTLVALSEGVRDGGAH